MGRPSPLTDVLLTQDVGAKLLNFFFFKKCNALGLKGLRASQKLNVGLVRLEVTHCFSQMKDFKSMYLAQPILVTIHYAFIYVPTLLTSLHSVVSLHYKLRHIQSTF